MDAIPCENETQTILLDTNGISGQAASVDSNRRIHQFQSGLGDHPLWQMYMEEMEALRQADIAEGNRLADLEMGL